jgi:hypothetical protein
MNAMFRNTNFNQNLSSWCVSLIPFEPIDFRLNNTVWSSPKPIWGTCPTPSPTPTNTPTDTPTIK